MEKKSMTNINDQKVSAEPPMNVFNILAEIYIAGQLLAETRSDISTGYSIMKKNCLTFKHQQNLSQLEHRLSHDYHRLQNRSGLTQFNRMIRNKLPQFSPKTRNWVNAFFLGFVIYNQRQQKSRRPDQYYYNNTSAIFSKNKQMKINRKDQNLTIINGIDLLELGNQFS